MSKAVITVASLGAGLAVFALIATIQTDPFTLTSHQGDVAIAPAPAELLAGETEPSHPARVALDAVLAAMGPAAAVRNEATQPMHVTAGLRRAAANASTSSTGTAPLAAPEEQTRSLVPCSPWFELGPKLGKIKGEGASRDVRLLC